MKQSQMNFKEIRLALLLFFAAATQACIPVPSHQSLLSNPENNRESKKKAWFIRLR
jgi:hypothetical protein